MKTSEDKSMVMLDFILLHFKITFYEHMLKQSSHSLFSAWTFFFFYIQFTPSEGPKAIFRSSTN